MNQNYSKEGTAGFFYALTVIGAAIYYIQLSTSFWSGVLGFLKAIVWPVFVTHKILQMLGM